MSTSSDTYLLIIKWPKVEIDQRYRGKLFEIRQQLDQAREEHDGDRDNAVAEIWRQIDLALTEELADQTKAALRFLNENGRKHLRKASRE